LNSLSGDSSVGKSSLILRFVADAFSEDPVVSIGGEFREKDFVVDGKTVRLQLWDTAGQERYRIITSSFYHNAQGTIIV
jgi:small GTP-binding protein